MNLNLSIRALRDAYSAQTLSPAAVVAAIFDEIERRGVNPVWISLAARDEAIERARAVDPGKPLAGIPFAVKDNIDVAGMPVTAACPAFAYTPARNAPVVDRLLNDGAILIGKTNLDQFATGLVGMRTPYGACSSVYHPGYISGGSSSGSAVAVASGLVSFALGTDTAGSGRVPAAFNGIAGLKPTRGVLSTSGVVPACRSLDCVSIFALDAEDAGTVFHSAAALDPSDPFSRPFTPGANGWLPRRFRFGVPRREQWEFFGHTANQHLYEQAIARFQQLGGECVDIDLSPFRAAAELLYAGPWVAERLAAVESFVQTRPGDVHPVVRDIITGAARYSAVDTFRALYRLQELRQATGPVWDAVDFLVLPTAPAIYRIAEVEADPIRLNSNLGTYTNFVNLLDLAAVAVPAGVDPASGLPFGVSLIGPAMSDLSLLSSARAFAALTLPAGPAACPPGYVRVAVVGAHLTGQPLNWQLTQRRGLLLETTRTSPDYRFYALAGTVPPKPGLAHEPGFSGPGIEVELWAVPESLFGGFVAAIPPPLGIGKVKLASGEWVSCFIAEGYALAGATEITHHGGWRAYLASVRG